MAFACFVTSPTLPTNLKPTSFSTSNKIYVLKGANNVYTRKNISCNYSSQQQLGEKAIPQNGQKGNTGLNPASIRADELRKSHFGEQFIFGAGTSAIQIEGNGTEGGRGPSTGDYMIHADKGGKGVDSYNKFKDDVTLLRDMGIPYYRFSIAWPRILPDGTVDKINPEGVEYYNKLLDELERNRIEPFVTLFHFDLPEALQKRYNGFMDRRIIQDFTNYCDLCFRLFGKRVKHWITINEGATFILFTDMCLTPEQREDPINQFIANHHILLSHASVAKLYREKYKKHQNGELGMAIVSKWFEPRSSKPQDQEPAVDSKWFGPRSTPYELDQAAADICFEFLVGWFMHPLTYGDYPAALKKLVTGLPQFTEEEKKDLIGSCDFFGINYYTAAFTSMVPSGQMLIKKGVTDIRFLIKERDERDGLLIGKKVDGVYPINMYPDGLRKILLHVKDHYKNQKVYITENGCSSYPKITMSISKAKECGNLTQIHKELKDDQRLEYFQNHLLQVYQAIKDGANVQGYIFWSLLDNNEFGNYDVRFGLAFVDYHDDYKRHLKKSGEWYRDFLAQKQASSGNDIKESHMSGKMPEKPDDSGNDTNESQMSGKMPEKADGSGNDTKESQISEKVPKKQDDAGGNDTKESLMSEKMPEKPDGSGNDTKESQISEKAPKKQDDSGNDTKESQMSGKMSEKSDDSGKDTNESHMSKKTSEKQDGSGNDSKESQISEKVSKKQDDSGNDTKESQMSKKAP